FGSTNGTFVNDEQVPANAERELMPGDRLKLGPLDFKIDFVAGQLSDSTPVPDALKSVGSSQVAALKAAAGQKPGSSPAQPPAAPPPAGARRPQPIPPAAASDPDHDAAAAMLLGLGDEEPGTEPQVPEGSTVFDMTSVVPPEGGEQKP